MSADRLSRGDEHDEMDAKTERPFPAEDGLGNIGYVRRLRKASEAGGVRAMAELVAPDVRWRPIAADGRVLNGTRDLDEFWSAREFEMPSLRMFHGTGDDVLVEAEYRREDAHPRTVWLLHRLRRRQADRGNRIRGRGASN
jgi:hypothetical protein